MRTGKRTGIHFLNDESIASRIVSCIDTTDRDVLEIGPGRGALTAYIKEYRSLCLIEKEKSFEPMLRQKFPGATILIGDALKLDWPKFDVFVSNMPYKITSPLLEKLWETDFTEGVITVQKEFADRLMAKKGTKDYSKMSIMMQLKFELKKQFDIHPSKFSPPPEVYSTVLTLTRKDVVIEEEFPEFLNKLFSQRRKKIKNIVPTELHADQRPEELSTDELLDLYHRINGKK